MSWNSFSQTGTDTTNIEISKPIAREVIRDLLTGDLASEQVKVLENLNFELVNKSDTQTKLITSLNSQIINYRSIITAKDSQIENHIRISETYKKAYIKEKKSKLVWKIAAGVAFGTGIIISK